MLNLIRAHALLHQATRQRDSEGRIVATLADYAAVQALVADLVAEGVEATVPATVRETIDAVKKARGVSDQPVRVSKVAELLGIDKSAASRRVAVALERGYLANDEAAKGKPYKLVIGDRLPEDTEVLPTVERLREVLHGCSVDGGDSTPLPRRVSGGGYAKERAGGAAMAESMTSEKRLAELDKQRQALEFRKAGLGFEAIARQLGYRGPSGAYYAVATAMRRTLQEPADELRALELARLDNLLRGIWVEARTGNVAKIDRVLKIMDRRASLLGLDAPQRYKDVTDRRHQGRGHRRRDRPPRTGGPDTPRPATQPGGALAERCTMWAVSAASSRDKPKLRHVPTPVQARLCPSSCRVLPRAPARTSRASPARSNLPAGRGYRPAPWCSNGRSPRCSRRRAARRCRAATRPAAPPSSPWPSSRG